MAQVLRALLASPLAAEHRMRMIVTYAVVSPPRQALLFARGLAELVIWCLGRGTRVVHVQSAVRGSLYRKSICVLAARLLRRPVLLQVHAGPWDIENFVAGLGPGRRRVFAAAMRQAKTVGVSDESARALERCFGLRGVGVLQNPAPAVAGGGVDVGAAGPATVLYLGGFADPAKGGEALVEALASLAPTRSGDRFRLFGPGDPPPALSELCARQPNVEWGGWLEEAAKTEAFRTASILVLPSLSEGLPVVVLEAMAWGRTILATAMGGVLDLVADGEDGVLVPPGDPGALGAALGRLLDDPERRRRLAAAAERRSAEFSEAAIWGRLDAMYEELAA